MPDSSEEHARKGDTRITNGGDSDNEVIPVSKRRQVEESDVRKDLIDSDDENPGEGPPEDMEATANDTQNGKENHHLEEKHGNESSEASKEHSLEEDKSDSERNQVTEEIENSDSKLEKSCESPSDPYAFVDSQISDDEPLVGASGLAFEFVKVVLVISFPFNIFLLDAGQVEA